MKIIILIFSFIFFSSFNKPKEDFSRTLISSFVSGDAYETNKLLFSNIELRIDAENINFKKAEHTQATEILKLFFRKYPASNLKFNQIGEVSNGNFYYIGQYSSITGHQFSIYILAKINSENKKMIKTLQIRNSK